MQARIVQALHEGFVTARRRLPRAALTPRHAVVIEPLQSARNMAGMLHPLLDELLIDDLPAKLRSRRIAVVTETYPPEVNGVAMSVARVVQGLHERNHQVQLVRPRQHHAHLPQNAERLDEVLTQGWPIPLYPSLRVGAPSKQILVRLWSLQRPDVVHIATEGPLGWSALHAALHLKLPVTSDFRTNFHVYGQHYRIGWLAKPIMGYLQKFHNRAHSTMVPTEALRAELAQRGFERLTVVSRGVDTELFHPCKRNAALRAQWGAGPDDVVLICVGRLAPEKNLPAVITAYEALRQSQPSAKLVLVGDGPQRAKLQARCPQALFAGQRSGDDLAAHYASADLFAFASLTETFGNVTLEALASGLPVVAFDCAAAGQCVRSGINGLLVPGQQEMDFVHATLAAAGRDAATRRQWASAARAAAQDRDWGEIVARFEAVLDQAIDGAACTPAHRAAWRSQLA
jgi:glycosyltransferase involved in cell wall biosynthesis